MLSRTLLGATPVAEAIMVAGEAVGGGVLGYTKSGGFGEENFGEFGSLSQGLFADRITDSILNGGPGSDFIFLYTDGDLRDEVTVTINSLIVNGTSCPVYGASFYNLFYPEGVTEILFVANVTFSLGSTYKLKIV